MKTYKVVFGGRGADLYLHSIDEEQKSKLIAMEVQDTSKSVDFDKINEVLKVDNWDYSEEVYTGTYTSPTACHITVFDEDQKLVWESDDDFFIELGSEDEDHLILEKRNTFLIEHSVKGVIKEYILNIDEDFDPKKFSAKSVDINEEVEIIVDLKYDDKLMEIDEWGDYWSKGSFFYIL